MAKTITDSNFETDVLASPIPVLLDFWAPWCGPCRAVAPAIDALAAELEGKALVAKLNVDENPATPTRFGVRAIPTFILFKNGQVVEQTTGASSKAALQALVQKVLSEK